MHFSYVLEGVFLGIYLDIYPQKSKLKNLHRNVCLSLQEFLVNYLSKRQAGRVLAKSLDGAYDWVSIAQGQVAPTWHSFELRLKSQFDCLQQ